MHLPFEIAGEVIRHFDRLLEDERAALQSCSLVCKAWVPLAQEQIFQEFLSSNTSPPTGENDKHTTPFRRLLDILSESPHLANYVRLVTIWFISNSVEWSGYHTLLVQILRQFTRVHSLYILSSAHGTVYTDSVQHTELGTAFQNMMSLPSFRKLRVHGMTFRHPSELASFLQPATKSLSFLHLIRWPASQENSDGIASALVELDGLKVLHLDGPYWAGIFDQRFLCMPNLLSYSQDLSFRPGWTPQLPDCLPNTINALEFRLFVYHTHSSPRVHEPPNLLRFSYLKTLALGADLSTVRMGPKRSTVILTMSHFLDKIPQSNLLSLESFNIRLLLDDLAFFEQYWSCPGWEALDASLTPLVAAGSLREVNVHIQCTSVPRDDEMDVAGYEKAVKGSLKQLWKTEVIRVKLNSSFRKYVD